MKQFLLPVLACLFISACVIHIGQGSYKNPNHSDNDIFGDVHVASGQDVQNIKSVHGSVELSHRATALNIESVNGNVEAGDWVQVTRIVTVNGNINTGEHFIAHDKVETINGNIHIGSGGRVGKNLQTINGDVHLTGVRVEGALVSFNGNTKLEGKTKILGNLVYKKQDDAPATNTKPTLSVGVDVSIDGLVIFEYPVELITDNPVIRSKVLQQF